MLGLNTVKLYKVKALIPLSSKRLLPIKPLCFWLGALFFVSLSSLAAEKSYFEGNSKLSKLAANEDNNNDALQQTLELNFSPESREKLRKALDDYARSIDQDHDRIEERRRVMQESLEARFFDADNDGEVDGPIGANGIPVDSNGGETPGDTDNDGAVDPYDVDDDGDFNDPLEFLGGNASAATSATFDIGIPTSNVTYGPHRLRVIAAFGTGPSFIVNGLSYFFVIAALMNLNEKAFFHLDRPKSDGSIREGIAYAKARPDIYVVMLMVFFLATFGLNFQIFNALMATQEFGLGPASFGLMGTFIAIGSLSGAIGSARLERFRNTKFVIKGGIAFSISIMVLSIIPSYSLYILWLPICGVTALTTLVSANSIVQTSTDPAIRGRVMGLYLLIFMGGTPFGSPLIGATTDLVGIRPTIVICGGISLAASLYIWFKYKNRVTLPADISVATVLKTVDRDHK